MNNDMVVVGDIHISKKLLGRSELILKSIQKYILNDLPEHGVVILGDVFSYFDLMHLDCLKIYCDFLNPIANRRPVYHILGNHEMANSVSPFPQVHALLPFEFMYNLIARNPRNDYYGEETGFIPISGPKKRFLNNFGKVGFIPYIPPNTVWDKVTEEMQDCKLLFCHQEFKGALYRKSLQKKEIHESEIGDSIPSISTISGHFHYQQNLSKTCWYPGTPAQNDYGDDFDKAIYRIRLLPNEPKGYQIIDKFALLDIPKFVTHYLLSSELSTWVLPNAEHPHERRRFVITGTKSELLAIKGTEAFKSLSQVGKIKFVVVTEDAPLPKTEDRKTFEQVLKEYAEQKGLDRVYNSIFE